jgi:hypothetical protein
MAANHPRTMYYASVGPVLRRKHHAVAAARRDELAGGDDGERPRSARVKVEMARAETEAIAGCNRSQIPQNAVLECEGLDRAGVFRLVWRSVVTARHQHDAAVGRRCENLVRIDAGIEIGGLGDRRADRAVGVEPMDGQAARIVVGGQQISAACIDADMESMSEPRSNFGAGWSRCRKRVPLVSAHTKKAQSRDIVRSGVDELPRPNPHARARNLLCSKA